jgi:hypothetical protein
MDEMRMGAAGVTEARSCASFSGLLISNPANSMAYPCAMERRLQRRGEERTTWQPVVRTGFFSARLLRMIDPPQSFGESPLHPATHPNAEAPNTSISSPALILLHTFFRVLFTKTLFSCGLVPWQMRVCQKTAPRAPAGTKILSHSSEIPNLFSFSFPTGRVRAGRLSRCGCVQHRCCWVAREKPAPCHINLGSGSPSGQQRSPDI